MRMVRSTRAELFHRIESLTGRTIVAVRDIQRGYTPAARLVLSMSDGTTLFAKIGTTKLTASNLRKELMVYRSLSGPFMPRYLGWDDDGINPILLLEDLSQAFWPPPWHDSHVEEVIRALRDVWRSAFPDLPKLEEMSDVYEGWQQVARDPAPFLSLRLATEQWLQSALGALLEIDGGEVVAGRSLLHGDVRSDNLCMLTDHRVILVDWNLVCVGNPDFDLGMWLPSLEAEGGPKPETILPDSGEIAAVVSGFFASKAGSPTIPDAPHVRKIQLVQLHTALPWAVRSLDLLPLDGDLA